MRPFWKLRMVKIRNFKRSNVLTEFWYFPYFYFYFLFRIFSNIVFVNKDSEKQLKFGKYIHKNSPTELYKNSNLWKNRERSIRISAFLFWFSLKKWMIYSSNLKALGFGTKFHVSVYTAHKFDLEIRNMPKTSN